MRTEYCSAKFYGTESSAKLAAGGGGGDETTVSPTRLLAVAIRKRRELFEEKEADLKLQIFHTSMIRALCKQMGEGRAKNKRRSGRRSASRSRSQKRQWSDSTDNGSQNNSEDRDSGFDSNSPSVSPPSPSSPPSQIVPYERSEFDGYDDLPSPYYRPHPTDGATVTEPTDASPIASKRCKVVEYDAFSDPTSYCTMTAQFNEDFGLSRLDRLANDRNGTPTVDELPQDYSRPFSNSEPSWIFDGRIGKPDGGPSVK